MQNIYDFAVANGYTKTELEFYNETFQVNEKIKELEEQLNDLTRKSIKSVNGATSNIVTLSNKDILNAITKETLQTTFKEDSSIITESGETLREYLRNVRKFLEQIPKGLTAKSASLLSVEEVKELIESIVSLATETEIHKPPVVVEKEVSRFSADCWTVDGNRSPSFCIYSDAEDSFTATFTMRKTNDFVATIFFSEDKNTHPYLSYETKKNYNNCTLSFTVDLSGAVPSLQDEVLGLTLTVITVNKYGAEVPFYIRLANLADTATLTDTHADVVIDWSNVKAGYYQETVFDKTNIDRVFLGCITNSYNSKVEAPFSKEETGFIKVSNIKTTGTNSTYIRNSVSVPQHTLGLCTSYDDSYNVNPSRIIKNCYDLGYRGLLNHYCGMSHYPDKIWNESLQRFVLTKPSDAASYNLVNKETTLWHTYLAKACKKYLMTPLFSISFEMYSEHAELEWTQRQYDDDYAKTGYEPPSYLLSPCNAEAMNYLQKVFIEFADISASEGLTPYLQVGEPWWWINSNGKPCIYDYQTRLKFNAETKLYAPEIENKNTVIDSEEYRAFLKFLQKELGNAVVSVKTAVNEKYSNAKVSTLFFLPSILDDMTSIAATINYPVDQYKYPNLDFIQTETYDWLVVGEFNKALRGFTSAIDELGYPPHLVHYLAGFVPDNVLGKLITPTYELAVDGVRVWQAIFGNMYLGKEYNVAKQYIWAYNQIMRDGIVVYPQDFLRYFWIKDKLYPSQIMAGQTLGKPVVNLPIDTIRPHEPETPNV